MLVHCIADGPVIFDGVQAVYREELDSSVDTNENIIIGVSAAVIAIIVLVASLYTIPSFIQLDRERLGDIPIRTLSYPLTAVSLCQIIAQPSSCSSARSPRPRWGS